MPRQIGAGAGGGSGSFESGGNLPIPGDWMRWTPSNAPELRMSLTIWQAKSTPALRSASRACMSGSGTVSSGICEESLRAIVAEGGAMTPAKTGPLEVDGVPPRQQLLDREAHLDEQEVRFPLPCGQRSSSRS